MIRGEQFVVVLAYVDDVILAGSDWEKIYELKIL